MGDRAEIFLPAEVKRHTNPLDAANMSPSVLAAIKAGDMVRLSQSLYAMLEPKIEVVFDDLTPEIRRARLKLTFNAEPKT